MGWLQGAGFVDESGILCQGVRIGACLLAGPRLSQNLANNGNKFVSLCQFGIQLVAHCLLICSVGYGMISGWEMCKCNWQFVSRRQNWSLPPDRPTVAAKSGIGLEMSISLSVCACLPSDLLQVVDGCVLGAVKWVKVVRCVNTSGHWWQGVRIIGACLLAGRRVVAESR